MALKLEPILSFFPCLAERGALPKTEKSPRLASSLQQDPDETTEKDQFEAHSEDRYSLQTMPDPNRKDVLFPAIKFSTDQAAINCENDDRSLKTDENCDTVFDQEDFSVDRTHDTFDYVAIMSAKKKLKKSNLPAAAPPELEPSEPPEAPTLDSPASHKKGRRPSILRVARSTPIAESSLEGETPASTARVADEKDPPAAAAIASADDGATKRTNPAADGDAAAAAPHGSEAAAAGGADAAAEAQAAAAVESELRHLWVQVSRALFVLTLLGILACVGVAAWHVATQRDAKHVVAWAAGALFVAVAVTVALHNIHLHVIRYRHPLQRYYMRVVWMVPVYAVESWLALRFSAQRAYLETMREAYEAYVIYSFYGLLREFLGDDAPARAASLAGLGRTHAAHLWCFFFCLTPIIPKWALGAQFLRCTSFGVLQYVPVKVFFAAAKLILLNVRTPEPCVAREGRRAVAAAVAAAAAAAAGWDGRRDAAAADNGTAADNATAGLNLTLAAGFEALNDTLANTTAAAAAAAAAAANSSFASNSTAAFPSAAAELECPNYYGEGLARGDRLYIYEAVVVTASQTWALYCMILFYLEARPLLEPLRPETKLIAVKGVVFVAFWQSLVITIAVRFGWVHGYSLLSYTAAEVAAGLQNFLICVEMALAAVLMYYAFSHKDFMPGSRLAGMVTKRLRARQHDKSGGASQAIKDMMPVDIIKETIEQGTSAIRSVGRLAIGKKGQTSNDNSIAVAVAKPYVARVIGVSPLETASTTKDNQTVPPSRATAALSSTVAAPSTHLSRRTDGGGSGTLRP